MFSYAVKIEAQGGVDAVTVYVQSEGDLSSEQVVEEARRKLYVVRNDAAEGRATFEVTE